MATKFSCKPGDILGDHKQQLARWEVLSVDGGTVEVLYIRCHDGRVPDEEDRKKETFALADPWYHDRDFARQQIEPILQDHADYYMAITERESGDVEV